ncbi:hypothetical protein SARC_02260 [Sphaeroforma arctica JP610]|uniref:26S proteasome non-ATPase regulatory subunit 5 n=1 Tax=Sphaeroforma arctica JP610 TaxID=667725 RepID=A0A0L0G9N4_9EUKA|nr:hypothetical protein SARC_02260 [Sphaeroforma arctica JP610]KNC85571.1 hypothetical protein SARC_02260 [Sphaeroforma arctica JP610]|eukprot:XP_014159473.1 hypothetical protein SARC_02260 [Sphaeroforma arctica JP610]
MEKKNADGRPQRAEEIEQEVGLLLLFALLRDLLDDQLPSACNVLRKVLDGLSVDTLMTETNIGFLRSGLASSASEVKLLCLGQIKKLVTTDKHVAPLQETDIFGEALVYISHEELAIAQAAAGIVASLAWTDSGLEYLCGSEVTAILNDLMDPALHDDVTRFRAYDAVVGAATISSKALRNFERVHLLDRVKADLLTDDPLLRVSVVQLFAEMSASPTIYQFLVESGALSELSKSVTNLDDPLTSYILPSVLHFYGGLANYQSDHFKQIFNENDFARMFKYYLVESNDNMLKATIISCIGTIGRSKEGLEVMTSHPEMLISMLKYCVGTQTELRNVAHNALASMLRLRDPSVDQYQQSIYAGLPSQSEAGGFVGYLQQLVRQPFEDIKICVYNVYLSLAGHDWGRKELVSQPGLVESLTDKRNDVSHEVSLARYDVIDLLSETGAAELSDKALGDLNTAQQGGRPGTRRAQPTLATMT